ncbi:MAG: dolichol kinase [Bacteroidetes bacterium]|nr:dolichol kinase [Bacteroidota bacterium]MCW5896434.1 dolichol kinase [Bacteroidota bacterium]
MNGFPNVEQSYAVELVRKTIHLCSLSIPVVYYFITKSTALSILLPLTLLFGLSDLARVYHPPTRELYHKLFGWLLRKHELDDGERNLNGATYVLIAACLFIWIFPKVVFITAFSILIISDTLAALVGRKFGKRRFLNKSLEGAAAFFLSALVVVALTPKVDGGWMEYLIGGIAALAGAVVESWLTKFDDNLSIPLVVGAVMWALYALLLPAVDVYALDMLR